jgi:hypothetical protein
MRKIRTKPKTSSNLAQPNRHKKPTPLPQNPDWEEKIRNTIRSQAERARVNGFVQLAYLPHILVHEKRYSDALLDRLWKYFECDRVPESRFSKSKYEMWFWIFSRWCGLSDSLWKLCNPISHLPLYDSETRKLKKERYGGRNDTDIVMLEDLEKGIESIGKSLNMDFPLPTLLFPKVKENKRDIQKESLTHSPDFRSINTAGKEFTLTFKQSQIVQILFDARERKTPDLGQHHIIEAVSPDTNTRRVRDLFKNNIAAWRALIEPGSKKGTVRLKG